MKKNGFKEATKKIKENYLCSMIAKATEYSVDSLNEKEMNEINSLISQLNAKTLSLVYSQFVINIMNKGISQDSAKWIEKICLKELPSSIFIPYQTSHLKQSFKDSSQTPLAFILTKASSEQASLFFSLYQDLINTIVEKTKFDTQELIYSIQEISLVDCSYTKEVIKKILLKNQSLLNDKNKKDIAIMLLNQEGAKSFNQYKNIIENKNISSTKIFEILALLDAQNIYQDKEAMSNIFFPDLLLDNCTERSRIELSINLGVKNLVSFIKLANLNEQEVKNYFSTLNIQSIQPELTPAEQKTRYGDKLWEKDPDQCCAIRKLAPLEKELTKYEAWISGLRREQSPTRQHVQFVNKDNRFRKIKICPLIHWTWDEVWDYINTHSLPYHPLHDQNYPSIGCFPCTAPVLEGEDLRSGRWQGLGKTECGLHRP